MFERLSVPSRQAIVRGHNECQKIADGQLLNSGHLLVGLAGRSGDQAQRALSSVGLSPESLELHLAKRSKSFEPGSRGALAGELRTVISSAVERRQPKLCILNTEDSIGLMVLTDAGVDVAELRRALSAEAAEADPPYVPTGGGVWAVYVQDDEEAPPGLRRA